MANLTDDIIVISRLAEDVKPLDRSLQFLVHRFVLALPSRTICPRGGARKSLQGDRRATHARDAVKLAIDDALKLLNQWADQA